MTINYINIGSSANKGDGDTLRTAFRKINENFAFLSTSTGFNSTGSSTVLNIGPTPPNTSNGTLWFNTTDARTYIRYNGAWVDASPQVTPPPTTGTEAVITIGPLPPETGEGSLWFNENDARTYINYGGAWIDSSPQVTPLPDLPPDSEGVLANDGYGNLYWTSTVATSNIDLLNVTTDILPDTNLGHNLGSLTRQWGSLYVGTSTIYLGGTPVTISQSNTLVVGTGTQAVNLASEAYVNSAVSNYVPGVAVKNYTVTSTGTNNFIIAGNGIADSTTTYDFRIHGTVVGVNIDYVKITVGSTPISAIYLTKYVSTDNRAFFAIQEGDQWTIPQDQVTAEMLAYGHFGPANLNVNILTLNNMNAVLQANTTYTFWIQQTGTALTEYVFSTVYGDVGTSPSSYSSNPLSPTTVSPIITVVGGELDPSLSLKRGFKYLFNINTPGHKFWVMTSSTYNSSAAYTHGITNNGTGSGVISFTVPAEAPDTLYYMCDQHSGMSGVIGIADLGTGGAVQGDTAPNDTTALWYDTESGRLYVNYDGGWVDASPSAGPTNPFNQSLNTNDNVTFDGVSSVYGFIAQINGTNPGQELVIQSGGAYNFTFKGNGKLQLPAGGDIVDSNGNTVLGGGGTGTTVVQSSTAPASTSTLWYDTNSGRLYLYYDSGWVDASPAGLATTPGGSDTQIQFNDKGTFAGHPNFTFNTTTDTLTVPDNIVVNNIFSVDSTVVHVHDDLETFGDFTAQGMYLKDGGSFVNLGNGIVDLNSTATLRLEANGKSWTYDTSGDLTIPGSIFATADFVLDSTVNGYNSGLYVNVNTATNSTTILYGTQDVTIRANNNSLPFKDWKFDANGVMSAPGNIVPTADLQYDLGTPTAQWRSLYVGTSTIYIGGVPLTLDTASNAIVVGNQYTLAGFDSTGTITFPDGSVQITAFTGSLVTSLANLSDVQISGPINTGYVLKYNGTKWTPAVDDTTGGAGTAADTLDGQHGDYYLNYVNFTGSPNLTVTTGTALNGGALSYNSGTFTFIPSDLSLYTTTATVQSLIANSLSNFTSGISTASVQALISNSLTNFVYTGTIDYSQLQNIPADNDPYTTTATVNSLIANSLTNYATQSYVTSQGYITTASTSSLVVGYATTAGNVVGGIGVSTLTAGTGTNVSAASGTVTVWIGQSVKTTDSVSFNTGTFAGDVYANSGNFRTTSSTAYIVNTTPTQVYMAGGATLGTYIGNTSSSVTIHGNLVATVNTFAIGYRDIPQLSLTTSTTLASTDGGKHYYSTLNSNTATITIPASGTTNFAIGTAINIVNQGTANINISTATGGVTLYLAGNATPGNRVLSSYGVATLQKVAADTWFAVGVGLS